MNQAKAQEVLDLVKNEGIEYVDLRFSDPFGQWQHLTIPAYELSMDTFENGRGFDGSSIRGWQSINESDMLAFPDPETSFIDPFMENTIVMICDIYDPITRERYGRDTRYIAQKAEQYLKQTGIGDVAYYGPEAEFFIFDSVEFGNTGNSSFWRVDSEEGWWNREFTSSGYKIPNKRGYFPAPPLDKTHDLRAEMVTIMSKYMGITVELHHHEVATAGQAEIDIRYNSLVKQADNLFKYKYTVRQVAAKYGKFATFMPKVLPNDNGTGMHTHFSIWKGDQNLFAGSDYAGISEICKYAIGGILKHGPALAAITNPTINSYHRLVPGFEAPVRLAYSARNRSASIRIPMYSQSPKAKRIEIRFPDPTTNPYLAFAAILMAAIDGIENKLNPGEPFDKDIYSLPPEELQNIPQLPGSLEESLKTLEEDYEFLLKGGVFTEEFIQMWIESKKEEINKMKFTPHPLEFELYFDI
ncbi:glutamine synthetase, type I [Hydrogenobaculum sp. Y04AAS1]|uniref:type I glutamate--ammonia ligase n=1 Tax=Hydrogenobaculum sp. (strain Y04AAS1) TaxID=380749 RepID=UPI00015BC690|nr:glutamine synthetase, type I [Hydrogenobaculum sp. Y04AAS1]HCT67236.1 type I glutamate--ammonia ligase [Hydrogenobaculum sp.]